LSNDEYGYKYYQKCASLSVECLIGSVEAKEQHIPKVLEVVQVCASINSQDKQGKDMDVLEEIENHLPKFGVLLLSDSFDEESVNLISILVLVFKYKATNHH
jgi:hypothetical protein